MVTADLVDAEHPAVEPLPSQAESSGGVDGINDPAETPDVDPTSDTPRMGERKTPTAEQQASDLTAYFISYPRLFLTFLLERNTAERQDYSGLYSGPTVRPIVQNVSFTTPCRET
ncbi:hypothetical protein OUZ56_021707 [Daphnia magna]|uniref:Uncharacterized protein n=1 Tax=Daphnia magna TaxID=35525 RepID=A0ABR0AUB4_9CRUS|nr:hypothetical protein OUZ56_021707 [Daphnia magna]